MSTKKEAAVTEEKATAAAVTEDTTTATEKTKVAPVQQVIYIGPTIKGVVVENTVFSNGLPEELNKKMQEVPAMKSLLVKVEDLARAKRCMNLEGSAENMCYKKVIESMEKGE